MSIRAEEERLADLVAEIGPDLVESLARTTEPLTRLALTVAAHCRADSSAAALEDVVTQAPRLASEAGRLRREHVELPILFLDLRLRAVQLQNDIQDALTRLDEHQQLALRLVYEAFFTDLGAGD